MAIITEYRLPGVYSQELRTNRVASMRGGYASIAFIGPSSNTRIAAQQGAFGESGTIQLNSDGVVNGTVTVRSRTTGKLLTEGTDFEIGYDEENDRDHEHPLFVKAKHNILALDSYKVGDTEEEPPVEITWHDSQPTVQVHVERVRKDASDDESDDGQGDGSSTATGELVNVGARDGYIIAGTLIVSNGLEGDDARTYEEGVDYTADYFNGTITARTGTRFTEGQTLYCTYSWTYAEPIKLEGLYAKKVQEGHRKIVPNAVTKSDGTSASVIIVTSETDGNRYGDTPNASDGYVEESYNSDGTIETAGDFSINYKTSAIALTANTRITPYDSSKNNLLYISFGYNPVGYDETVIIEYEYSDETLYEPQWFEDYNAAVSVLGDGWYSSGVIRNEVMANAYLASRNGLRGFYVCGVRPQYFQGEPYYPPTMWQEAFDKLTSVDGIDIIVPLSGDESVWSLAVSHLTTMLDNDDERMAILGFDGIDPELGVDTDSSRVSVESMMASAQSISRNDVVMVAPSTFRFRNPMTSVVGTVPGYYVASALAGYLSSVPQYTSLTRKSVNGIFSANEYYSKNVKRQMCASGLCYVDEFNTAIRVLHGKTTSTTSIIDQEANITLTKYFIIKRIRDMYEDGFIGEPLTDNLLSMIKASITSALSNLSRADYIYDYGNITVTINEDDPTEVDIMFDYRPTYALNYIVIQFSIDTSVDSSTYNVNME